MYTLLNRLRLLLREERGIYTPAMAIVVVALIWLLFFGTDYALLNVVDAQIQQALDAAGRGALLNAVEQDYRLRILRLDQDVARAVFYAGLANNLGLDANLAPRKGWSLLKEPLTVTNLRFYFDADGQPRVDSEVTTRVKSFFWASVDPDKMRITVANSTGVAADWK